MEIQLPGSQNHITAFGFPPFVFVEKKSHYVTYTSIGTLVLRKNIGSFSQFLAVFYSFLFVFV